MMTHFFTSREPRYIFSIRLKYLPLGPDNLCVFYFVKLTVMITGTTFLEVLGMLSVFRRCDRR